MAYAVERYMKMLEIELNESSERCRQPHVVASKQILKPCLERLQNPEKREEQPHALEDVMNGVGSSLKNFFRTI